jgi:hypothetical protein
MLCLHSSDTLFNQKISLNNLVSQTIATSPRLLHASIGIPFGPITFPPFILFKTSLTSDSCILCTKCLLRSSEEMSNSMDELPISSLKSLSKYSCHLFLVYSSLVRSCSISSLIHLTYMMSIIFLCLPFTILYMSFFPSFVPSRWYSLSYI